MGAYEKFLEKNLCVQDAVYWPVPADDGLGGFTWDEPRDIKVRWDNSNKMFTDTLGNELTSQAVVTVMEDLDLNGMLCLGTIESLMEAGYLAGNLNTPREVPGTYSIKRADKIPLMSSTTEFFRQVYLAP